MCFFAFASFVAGLLTLGVLILIVVDVLLCLFFEEAEVSQEGVLILIVVDVLLCLRFS